MLSRITKPIPGLFITGTDTGVGKTVIAAAIANHFKRRGMRVGVSKPIATGCVHRREGLVSEDAEFLAHHADSSVALDVICPQRFAEPLAPAVAAERAGEEIDWPLIDRSIAEISSQCDVLIVEGVGGVLVPLDEQHLVLDMARWLSLPTIIVARPGLGTINHTLLTALALRGAGVPLAGIVINQYPAEMPGVAEETNPQVIEQWSSLPVLCLAPLFDGAPGARLPADFVAVIDAVDWAERAMRR
ncbi:MAG: dethiobiotin synthase [Planctomycetota bacterium]|nr:dethiobiotin synthase [Planctomycetota bacterium]